MLRKLLSQLMNPVQEEPARAPRGGGMPLLQNAFNSHALGLWLLDQLPEWENRIEWSSYLDFFGKAGDKPKPGDKWLAEMDQYSSQLQEQISENLLLGLLEEVVDILKQTHASKQYFSVRDLLPTWFRGLVWYVGKYRAENAALRNTLEQITALCLRKKPGHGPLAPKNAFTCLRAFALMPGANGVPALVRLHARTVFRSAVQLIDELLEEIAQRTGMSRGDIEDLSVGDFGLKEDQQLIVPINGYQARIFIKDQAQVLLEWSNPEGKVMKTVPTAVKADNKAFKAVQALHKELRDTFQLQFTRIENAYLEQRSWQYGDFKARYEQHPLMQALCKRLIWRFEKGDRQVAAMLQDGVWQNPQGERPDWLDADTRVQLWHPLDASADSVLEWRKWLIDREITQPFKQAYREIYVLTPPERNTRTYSNRFAAHILRQHQLSALCQVRGWGYRLQGAFDSHNVPRKYLRNWGYQVEFWVESAMEDEQFTSDYGIFLYVSTDQVRFYRETALVPLDEVPVLLFSELMRDVDLFVGVCSIGNDPNWQDGGEEGRFMGYWREYAFSDQLSAGGEMRLETLKRIIPRLAIGPKCRFEGKFLLVEGSLHTYKIHCGSGNILMSPNDRYLCIVPDSGKKTPQDTLYLPFEGDRMLSIIISKAVMLANDHKITDETIVRQL